MTSLSHLPERNPSGSVGARGQSAPGGARNAIAAPRAGKMP